MKDYSYTCRPSDIFPTGAFELKVSYQRKSDKRFKIIRSEQIAEFAKEHLYMEGAIEYSELFFVLFADRANQVYAWKKISEGGMAGTVVDPKLIFQTALLAHATSIFMVHNHPSGNHKPSEADIRLTKSICDGSKFLEICVLDHVIVSTEGFFSFADEGLL